MFSPIQTSKFHQKIKKPKSQSPLSNVIQPQKTYMRNIISNIYNILKYSTWDSAQEELTKLNIKWDSFTVNQILKTHPPMEKAWLFFSWASKLKRFKHDQFTCTTMLDIFGEAGRIESMKYVFKKMQEMGLKIDVVTYTSILNWVSKSGDVDGAVEIWKEMRENRCFPTVVSYTAYLKVLLDNKRVKEGIGVCKEMLESGISPNCHTYTVLMEYLVVSGDKMQEAGVQPDKAACNILVERCCKAGETMIMTQILQYMKQNQLVLRYPVYKEALRTLKDAGESDALLRKVNPHIDTESFDRGLVLILLRKHNLVAVDHLLAGTMDKNILLDSWIVATIIERNCDHQRADGALLAFEYSMKMGIQLERTSYLALIGMSIRSDTSLKVVDIAEKMTLAGHSLGVYQASLLIYRLGCAKRPTCAVKIFDLLPEAQKCTATYTALVSVYFSAGSPQKALQIYEDMKREGIHPSLGTYNVLLAGLERSGRISEAKTFRKEKKGLLINNHHQNSVPWGKRFVTFFLHHLIS
ncbi:pentatricopeptide repeat-containing protein [Salix suchowensis]|nr:pentatricopeptide repeat-containing protein [Salix suchowensis]